MKDTTATKSPAWRSTVVWVVPALLGLVTYLPALDNGFISDDFVMLEWASHLKDDPGFLLGMAPDVFRITTYLLLWFMQSVFGYSFACYYAVLIVIHAVNCGLLFRLLLRITRNSSIAFIAAAFFAVVQNPQEAIMWIAAMAYALGGLCILGTLLLWLAGRYRTATLVFLVALFTTESAMVLVLLLPLVELADGRRPTLRREYLYLSAPIGIFSLVFWLTLSGNYMVTPGTYRLGPHGGMVLLNSLHRLMFPWMYVAIAMALAGTRLRPNRSLGYPAGWMTISLLPFLFLTYQNHVPSRHTYLAAMGLTWGLALLLAQVPSAALRHAFAVAFVLVNMGYVARVKDAQFEERAAPTTLLLEQLRTQPPVQMAVLNFPLNPWIAKMASRMVAGWSPEMLKVNEGGTVGGESRRLQWDPVTSSYRALDWKAMPESTGEGR